MAHGGKVQMKVWSRWRLGAARHTLGKRLLQLITDTVLTSRAGKRVPGPTPGTACKQE